MALHNKVNICFCWYREIILTYSNFSFEEVTLEAVTVCLQEGVVVGWGSFFFLGPSPG